MVERTTEGRSSLGFFSSPTFFSMNTPSTSTRIARGTMAPIMVRQPYVSITAPPTTGPTAGPADMTMPAMPIAVPRFSTGNTSMGTTETSGMSTPEPAACNTRPMMRNRKSGAAAHSSVPSANTSVAPKNSARVLNLSIRNAETGTMMPLTSGYMDMIHWAVEASMAKSDMMTGSAGDITVWFSSAKKAPRTTTATMRIWVPVMRPLAGATVQLSDISFLRIYSILRRRRAGPRAK